MTMNVLPNYGMDRCFVSDLVKLYRNYEMVKL